MNRHSLIWEKPIFVLTVKQLATLRIDARVVGLML